MLLSIVIVNWNTTRLLDTCLDSIYRHVGIRDFEVIVVDNASADFSEADFRSKHPSATLFANQENLGYAEGNNQAIAASTGDYVLLLNPDTELTSDAPAVLVDFLQNHPDAAAVGCKLVRPTGAVDRSVRGFPYPLAIASELLGLSKLLPKSHTFGAYRMTWFGYDTEVEVDQPMGSCLMLSRRAIDQIGLFDQLFPIFFNEVDWCYRAKQAGWRIFFTPAPEVIHHGGSSTRQIRKMMKKESHRSLARFYKKHFRKRVFAPLYWLILAAIKVSEVVSAR